MRTKPDATLAKPTANIKAMMAILEIVLHMDALPLLWLWTHLCRARL
jgi:hypothetical protein